LSHTTELSEARQQVKIRDWASPVGCAGWGG
jgi:hypothetical protein